MIYSYFGIKDDLFDIVFTTVTERAIELVPFDPEDLPGYAGRLLESFERSPDTVRLTTWYQLERPHGAPLLAVVASNVEKLQALQAAMDRGLFLITLNRWNFSLSSERPRSPGSRRCLNLARPSLSVVIGGRKWSWKPSGASSSRQASFSARPVGRQHHSPRRRHASRRPAVGAIASSGTTASISRLQAALLGGYQLLILSEYAGSIRRKANR